MTDFKDLIDRRELFERYRITWSAPELRRKEGRGAFPRRVKLGHRSIRWVRGEIEAWLEQMAAARG